MCSKKKLQLIMESLENRGMSTVQIQTSYVDPTQRPTSGRAKIHRYTPGYWSTAFGSQLDCGSNVICPGYNREVNRLL